jgi:DNA primase
VIEEAKSQVRTIDLADRLVGPGKMRRMGAEWVANCPLPEHEDRTPSFTVNPEKNVFWCHGCLRGGDVVELARFAWGYEKHEVATAAADLLHEFGHELPERPASWYRKQARQDSARRQLERNKGRLVQRRLYRWFYAPRIRLFEDEEERLEEARIAWEECALLARLLVEGGGTS